MGELATLFVAAPLYSWLRDREPAVRQQSREVLEQRTTDAPPVSSDPVSA